MPPDAPKPSPIPSLFDIEVDPYAPPPGRRRKADVEALRSPWMRINGMRAEGARTLLDLGFRDLHEVVGRCPEALHEELARRGTPHPDARASLRLAVYAAETEHPDPNLLRLEAWR